MMRLDVHLGGTLVGWLDHDGATNRFAFTYSPQWVLRDDAFPLSPHLALPPALAATPDQHSAAVRQFFENLLPEGRALDDAAAAYKVSKSNLAGLLAALGRETAGAISVRVAQRDAAGSPAASRRLLAHEELAQRIGARPQLPFSVWDGKVRLSIAGYQDKVAVFEDAAGQWFLVEGEDAASTHILKPEPTNRLLAGLTTNEFFCMRLARHIKLPVADVQLHHIPEPVLSIRRFDRRVVGASVQRIHALDGCQALGLPVGFKYERPYGDSRDVRNIRDGASLPRLFRLLHASARPAFEQLALLRWAIFQVLIGNTDAHAKNLTFLSGPGGLSLAPAYDLVCGVSFSGDRIDQTYAMAVGDAFCADDISPFAWAQLCMEAGLNPAQVKTELLRMSLSVARALPVVASEVVAQGADTQLVDTLIPLITTECARQEAMAAAIPAMAREYNPSLAL